MLLLVPAVAAASAEDVAVEAAQIVELHCSDAVADDTTTAAQSVTAVSPTWARVSEQYEASGEPWLLYWRGVLGACLNQDKKAIEDLDGFVAALGDDPAWSESVRDAERRLRRLRVPGGVEVVRAGVPIGLGLGLAGSSVGLGALAGWQHSVALDKHEAFHGGELTVAQFDGEQEEGQDAELRRDVFAGVAGALAAGSAAAFVVAAVRGQRLQGAASRARRRLPTVAVAPSRSGVHVVVGGRW